MTDSLHAAERAADAGMDEALRAERVRLWKLQALVWLDGQPEGRTFTADDLVAAIGLPDTGAGRNNVVGAWVNAQSKARRIEFTGELGKSSREAGHGNLQRVWRVTEGRVGGDAERLGPDGVSSSPEPAPSPRSVGEGLDCGSTVVGDAPPRWRNVA